MPLDRETTAPLYRIGRVWALLEAHTRQPLPDRTLDIVLRRPLEGLALMQAEVLRTPKDDRADIQDGIGEILSAADDIPVGPLPPVEQGPFWLGYYHQRVGQRLALSTADLERAGRLLFGDQWQSDLSRALGQSSTRRLREWIERGSVPIWARGEIYALLMARSRAASELARELLAHQGATPG